MGTGGPTRSIGSLFASGVRCRERLAAVGLGFALLVLMLELALRLVGATAPQPTVEGALSVLSHGCPTCPRVLCLGDSFTYGIGATPGHDYPQQLEALLSQRGDGAQVTVINAGMGGANTGMVLSSLPEFIQATEPQAIVVLVGGSNRVNFFGYSAWRKQSSLLGRLEAVAFEIRVLRLARHGWAQLHHGLSAPQLSPGRAVTARYFVQSYLRWWRDHHEDDWPSASFERGLELLALGQAEEAISVFEDELRRQPDSAPHLWGLGTSHRVMHDHDNARRWFRAAIEADPTDPNSYFAMGDIFLDEGRPVEEALQWLEQGKEAEPGFGANYCVEAGILFRTVGPEAAWAANVAGLRADPFEDLCYRDLLENARLLGRQDQARELLLELGTDADQAQVYLEMLHQQSLDREIDAWIRDDLQTIASRAEAHDIPVLFLTYPFPSPANPSLRQVAQEHLFTLVDIEAVFEGQIAEGSVQRGDLFVRDGHCNDRGYALMAAAVRDGLERAGLWRSAPARNQPGQDGARAP